MRPPASPSLVEHKDEVLVPCIRAQVLLDVCRACTHRIAGVQHLHGDV